MQNPEGYCPWFLRHLGQAKSWSASLGLVKADTWFLCMFWNDVQDIEENVNEKGDFWDVAVQLQIFFDDRVVYQTFLSVNYATWKDTADRTRINLHSMLHRMLHRLRHLMRNCLDIDIVFNVLHNFVFYVGVEHFALYLSFSGYFVSGEPLESFYPPVDFQRTGYPSRCALWSWPF